MTDAFDITKLLGAQVSKLDTAPAEGREQIEYIDIDRIDDDPNNFYTLSEINELAANIELFGLQQPLRVRPNPDDPDRVILVSGHRRRAAIRQLVDGGRTDLRKIACIRERAGGSAALQELRLIYANSDTRRLTSAEISKQAERVETLLYQLKEEGYEFPGRMRDQVAAACQVSAPKLARLKVIREHLIPQWLGDFQRDALPEQTAYALARMPEELQERLHRILGDKPPLGGTAERLLSHIQAGATWTPIFTCIKTGQSCRRGDSFLRHDAEHPFEACLGERCCLDCDQAKASYYACDRMCSQAKALRKDARNDAAAKEEARKAAQQKEYRAAIQSSAARLLRAAEAAGLTDETELKPRSYYAAVSVADLRAYAAGEFGEKYFYTNDLAPENLDHPEQIARTLHCSADYVLGLTDELIPVGRGDVWHWWPEEPQASGLYWCITGPFRRGGGLYWWNDQNAQWEDPTVTVPLTVSVSLWMRCPELPTSMRWERQVIEDE